MDLIQTRGNKKIEFHSIPSQGAPPGETPFVRVLEGVACEQALILPLPRELAHRLWGGGGGGRGQKVSGNNTTRICCTIQRRP